MNYEKRGRYNYPSRGRQLILFDGLEMDSHITPMDVDAYIEYHDNKRVLIEVKMQHVEVPRGQRIALERMVDDFTTARKDAIAIVADHREIDGTRDIMLADCTVRELYYGRERCWRPPKKMMRVDDFLRLFLLHSTESNAS